LIQLKERFVPPGCFVQGSGVLRDALDEHDGVTVVDDVVL
jgi:hypothetical protein